MIKRAKRRSKWVINSQDNDKNFLAQRFMIVLLPVVLTLTNSHWLVNKNDIDVWFYFGYFKDFLAFSDSYSPDFAHTYYGTRLPFTLPGHLIFKLFGVSYGNFVLSVLFIYLLTVFSFYRILRLYVNRNVALLGTLLLTTDVYLWHAVGSDYVNTGVLIYSMLSILTLEAGARRRRPYLFVLSGFFLISAITTNLSFLFYLPFFVAIFLSLLKRFGKIFARTNYIYLFWMISGAFMCIIFYSIIFGFYTGQWQIFFLAQIETAKNVSIAGSFAQPFSFIFTQGLWVTVLFSALVSSFIALIVSLKVRTFRHFFNRDQKIFLATFFLFFLSFLLIAPVEFRYLMSRDGLYLPFILPMGYVALTIVCFGSNTVSQKFTLITGCLFFLLTWLHIGLRDGSGFASNHVEAWSLILISSLLILLSWLFRS